jgi:uncharacterized protein
LIVGLRRDGSIPTRHEIAVVALLAGANIVLNRVVPRRYIVPSALTSAAGMVLVARMSGVTVEQQGLSLAALPAGVKRGLLVGIPLAAATLAGAFLPSARSYYRDERVVRASASSALYEIFVRIPLATAASEELMFRSALEAMLRRRRSSLQTLLLSNALFGAWHVFPALDHVRSNPRERADRGGTTTGKLRLLIVHCCATAVAGVALSMLRRSTGSVAAPILVHYSVNGGAFGGSWLASNLRTSPNMPTCIRRVGKLRRKLTNTNHAKSALEP